MLRKPLLLITSLCLVAVVSVFVLNKRLEKVQASAETDMFEQIDSKALAAQSGEQSAISDLVDTIFAQNGVDQLDPDLVATLKDRIVRAELNGQTVSETQVVQALNWLAGEFSAPDYARTSPLQMRVMRLIGNGILPNLFVDKDNQGNIGLDKELYSQPSSNMPATQAVTLLIIMIHQKVLNEHFQKEPAQWDSDFYAAQQSGDTYQQSSGGSSPRFAELPENPKRSEMRQLVNGNYFSQADQERLTQGTLDQLGIPR